jgi:MoxR-like ATPase
MESKDARSVNIEQFQQAARVIEEQLAGIIVGQKALLHDLLVTLLAGGNALLEGIPGLGKTLLIRTLAQVLDCSFNRIQFTPDLMPADIVGTMIITETENGKRGFRFVKGPIFANLVLADEINRAAPRTQSALLEAMQEQHVTVAGETHSLPRPFFVLATQNPIEMEGTYPLPEAQIDRFLYKLHVPYPSEDELIEIARRTTGPNVPAVDTVVSGSALVSMQHLARQVPVANGVYRYAARIVGATHPDAEDAIDSVRRNLRIGASPRGLQAMIWGGKVEALLDNRKAVAIDDIRKVVYPALRHRLILNFEAQAEGVNPDTILDDIIKTVAVPT